jgi:Abnormal spindle-like microcephaly-assoc'd, ASPM-SPD-2-Hydin
MSMDLSFLRLTVSRRAAPAWVRAMALGVLGIAALGAWGQSARMQPGSVASGVDVPAGRAQRFLGGRVAGEGVSAAQALAEARAQSAQMKLIQAAGVRTDGQSGLNATWQAVGPGQVASLSYGDVTGRVSSVAIDPADSTGNTVYVGTTGGGVWKSINAAGVAGSVTLVPLTDTLPVFSGNAGTTAIPSLSIGAVSVNNGVVLAGTGDPNDATDSYYGSGILRSVDGGVTWTLIQFANGGANSYNFAGLGFAGFAWSSSGTVVAAVSQSAEGALVNAASATGSVMGLYYSTDAGQTWQMATLMDGAQTVQTPLPSGGNHGGNAATAVAWNPMRRMFYAAVRYHGYYQSADGVTWTRLTAQPGTGLTTTACPTNPELGGSLGCPIFRGALAVEPVSGDMYALTVDAKNLDQGLWRDVCHSSGSGCAGAVAFVARLNSAPLEVGSGSTEILQGDYDLSLAAVNAGTDTLVYAGTVDLYRCSVAAGCSLRNTTNALNGCTTPAKVAPAQHAIATLATAAQPLVYLGNDGGFWRSTDGVNEMGTPCSATDASHFDNLNPGLGSLAEVVSFAQDPVDTGTLIVGLGANGTAGIGSAASGVWGQLSAGEGGVVAIDQAQPSLWYVSTAAGVSVTQCSKGSECAAVDFAGVPTIGAAQVADDTSAIDAPWLLDPALDTDLIVGTCRVWRGPAGSGAAWSSANVISRMLGGTQAPSCAATNPVVRSLGAGGAASGATAAQNAGSKVLYAGMAGVLDGGGSVGGHVFGTANGDTATSLTAWTDLTASPVTNDAANSRVFNPAGFDVSSVVVDSHDATGATVYATVMGFSGNGLSAPKVYRSTSGGASWTNITSNLPNAPANALVVDPNDANTLYVAMDTGVYVTTSVASCSTANCWSVYGNALPNAPVVGLAAAAGMATGDGRMGELRAATYGRGIWEIPLLTATTGEQAAMTVSPGSLSFAGQPVGTVSIMQTVAVTNSGVAPLTVSQVVTSGDFIETDDCVGSSIAVGASCSVQVSFLPTTTGGRPGVLTVFGNVAGGQATVALSGTGTPGSAVVLTPVTVSFATTAVGSSSAAMNVTISNTSSGTIGLQAETVAGDFAISANTCGSSLASQTGCTVAVVFRPTASGARQGRLTVVDDAGMQTAVLSGRGTLPATDGLAPSALVFGQQQIGSASAAQQVTLTNTGDVALSLIAASTTGDFSVVNGCGNSLNGHSSCSMNVIFNPHDVGSETGVLTVADEFRSQTVGLSGVGVAPAGVSLAPTVGFGATGVGVTSTAQTVTLTNNGGSALAVSGVSIAGDFVIAANGCGSTLAQGAACAVQVVFAPTVGGARSGTLTVMYSAAGSPQTVVLSGAGVDFSLAPDGPTSLAVSSGQSAVFPLLVGSAAAVSGTVTLSCAGAPAHSVCTVSPASVTLGSTTLVRVTVQTGSAAASAPGVGRGVWWGVMLPVGWMVVRRRRLGAVVLLCCLIAGVGCGAAREIPGSGDSGGDGGTVVTPSGSYSIVVTASSAGLSRTANLTLVVQSGGSPPVVF